MDDVRSRFAYRAEIGLRIFSAALCFVLATGWAALLAWGYSAGKPFYWQEAIFPALLFGGGLLNVFQLRRMRVSPQLALKNWSYDLLATLIPFVGVPVLLSLSIFSALHILRLGGDFDLAAGMGAVLLGTGAWIMIMRARARPH